MNNTKRKNPADLSSTGFSFVNYNAIFDTGCIGLQSCIEMQPKMGMQLLEIIT